MKIPFGKYKGTDITKIPFDYILWLSSLELKDPLKSSVEEVTNTDEYADYLSVRSRKMLEHLQETIDNQRLECDYIKDIKFWGRVSPNAVLDTIRKNRIDVDIDTWKWVVDNAYKTPF